MLIEVAQSFYFASRTADDNDIAFVRGEKPPLIKRIGAHKPIGGR
jgi:hypothetical protein